VPLRGDVPDVNVMDPAALRPAQRSAPPNAGVAAGLLPATLIVRCDREGVAEGGRALMECSGSLMTEVRVSRRRSPGYGSARTVGVMMVGAGTIAVSVWPSRHCGFVPPLGGRKVR